MPAADSTYPSVTREYDKDDEEPSDDDDDDAEEEEHLAPADPAAIAYSADQDPYLAYRVTARMSIRPHARHRSSSEEDAERLICSTASSEAVSTTPVLEYEVGEMFCKLDDLVGAIQEIAPTTLEGVNQRVTELATTVDQEDEIIYSQLDDARYDRALLRARVQHVVQGLAHSIDALPLLMDEEANYLVPLGHSRWMLAIRSVESRPSETETVSGDTKDSEEPQDSDDRASEIAGTC
ncbi:hypothetical protein Tco_0841340 [Tanacetum coccineum]|uniref:Magnesium transporter n=1 Tax=Tanacetum coccineum TaxID=301880 RepID=A0ABQ5AXF6_9ASTR